MRTLFDLGLARAPWSPDLGQAGVPAITPAITPGFWSTLTAGLTSGGTAYTQYEQAQIAEERRLEAQATAETNRIKAEADRLRAQTAAAAAGTGGAGAGPPTGYLIAGGIGLAAIIGAIALLR
jgi:hypothetical protein